MRFLLLIAPTVSSMAIANNAKADSANAIETQARHQTRKPNAQELQRAKDLPATVVVRVNASTGQMEYAQIQERLPRAPMAMSFDGTIFQPVDLSIQPNSVQLASSSSWLFYFLGGLWNQPTYNYYGYDYGYSNYYSYPYNNWNYSYYSWPYYW